MHSVMCVEIIVTLDKNTNLKERRAMAQKLRDQLKNSFNASVKIHYLEHRSQFCLMVVMIGESEDYLEDQLDQLAERIEVLIEEEPRMTYQIDGWPL